MLWVCWFHAVSHFLNDAGSIGLRVYSSWWPVALPMAGDTGVELFLVLSGFLLGGTLFRDVLGSRKTSWCRFYFQRWVRICPAYASTLIISALTNLPHGSHWGCRHFWWAHMLFINNYFPYWESYPQPGHRHLPMCCIHTWSVAVEFQLYFLTPPLFALALRLSSAFPWLAPARAVVGLCAFAWGTCCALRVQSAFYSDAIRAPYPDTLYRMSPYLAGIVAGITVALHEQDGSLLTRFSDRKLVSLTWLASATLAVTAVFGAEPGYMVDGTGFGSLYAAHWATLARLHTALLRPLVSLAVAFLLVLAVTGRAPRLASFLSWPIWHPVAGLSYSMYLLQYAGSGLLMLPLFDRWVAHAHDPSLLRGILVAHSMVIAAILGTVPLALLNYALVERPSMLAGKRFIAMVVAASKDCQDGCHCIPRFERHDDLVRLETLVKTQTEVSTGLTDSFPFGIWTMMRRRTD